MSSKHRVILGLSGGVDSSVAAWLLKRAGHEVVGVFMKNWEDDDTDAYCASREDLVDAAAVADVIGIEIEAVNFAREYRERVFAHFLTEYASGRTPNPDVLCNSEIKFNAFLDHAVALGAERIATGHYAQLRAADDRVELLQAVDGAKDQTYFLHRLNQKQLVPTLFPVGHLRKSAVRAIAREQKLPTYAKKDSTGICFIGERPFRAFLERYLPRAPGPIETPEGRVLGQHQGLAYYTLGQRQGLGIGGMRGAKPGCLVRRRQAGGAQCAHRRAGARRSAPLCEAPWSSTPCTGLPVDRRPPKSAWPPRPAIAWRTHPVDWMLSPTVAGGRPSRRHSGRLRRGSISCSTTATAAWAER